MKQSKSYISILFILVLALTAACGGSSKEAATEQEAKQNQALPGTPPPEQAQEQAPDREPTQAQNVSEETPATYQGEYAEAPMLAETVKAGKLPPVSERVPKQPMVLRPVERVGKYGGDWDTGLIGEAAPEAWLENTIGYEHLVRWQPNIKSFSTDEVVPNVAESFEIGGNGAEYTFKLREGMKWSDGKPFTADDVMFWYEDVLTNKELTPKVPRPLISGGKPVTVEKVDDYTVTFRFAKPNGLFLQFIATPNGGIATGHPRHYLKQFHSKYNKQAEQQAKQANLESWAALFDLKSDPWNNPELPTLHGWVLTASAGGDAQQLTAERNPYYWKVDTEGNQLPYLDRVVYAVVQDDEVFVLKALNGEVDFHFPNISSIENKPLFHKNREKGNYHLVDIVRTSMNAMIIAPNLTHKDPVKREVFQNKDFRIGLSHAINRQEIIDAVFVSQGEPLQAAPRPQSPFYNERLAKQYTEYSVEKANQSLDKVLPKKDAEGFRLGPDGKRFSFQVDVITPHGSSIQGLEMIQPQLRAVGIDMRYKAIARELFLSRLEGNQQDATAWFGQGGLDVVLNPSWYFPFDNQSHYAIPWANWYNKPKDPNALEPPPATKKQMELYEQLQATVDAQKQAELMKQILEISADEFYAIGINLWPDTYGIVKNNFHNVPKSLVHGAGTYANPAVTNPQQYFVDE